MEYSKLGKSDLNVSRICMGCMGFGNASTGQHSWTLDEEHSREIIKHGLELGVDFFDTAIVYQNGTSERFVGRALRDFANRDDIVVATKFTPRTYAELEAGISGQKHIETMIDKSPVVSATKFYHIDGAVKAVDLKLKNEEIAYLEEM